VLTVVMLGLGCAGDAARDLSTLFDVMEKSISELGAALESGQVTSRDLVAGYLARIEAFDRRGPALNAIVAINPAAMETAAALDAERALGNVRGSLHGIPVLIKDNYDTVDMPTTAGTIALATSVPPDDAFQVAKLREAGAIILGKTNMHELARGITTVSSFVGQTRNPYDPSRNPGGSSGGTGAAVGASLAAVGMGSDTCGSIRIPSSHQALVGLRGTRGLASGDGIIPLSTTQDIGGPLARSVEDLAITLDATVGFDPADVTTRLSEGNIPETYTAFLNENGLQGARFGIVMALMGEGAADQPVRDVMDAAFERMKIEGAEIIEIEEPDLTVLLEGASLIGQEFKFGFDAYLRRTPGTAVQSLEELVELGLYHQAVDRSTRGSLEIESLDTDDYRARVAKRDEVRGVAVGIMDEHDLDALLYPTIRRVAVQIGEGQPGSNCALSAISGLPAITVPAGFTIDEMPAGLELLGRPWTEPRLMELAYAFEHATRHRRPPDFTPSLVTPPTSLDLDVMVSADSGLSVRPTFTLDPATRILRYSLSVFGLQDPEVLSIDLHRRVGDAKNGPVVRLVSRRRSGRAAGRLTLSGGEIRALRDGKLYLDVHTTARITGALRVDLALPK
jgi:Asp-tRNA(Asn)/Glu-tRNA(Gln) amidotransferase A subunit family amidase